MFLQAVRFRKTGKEKCNMKESSSTGVGIVMLIILFIGLILFARYAVETNPCNTKAYKRSLPSYSSYSPAPAYKPVSTPKPSTRSKRSTKKSYSTGLNASDYYHQEDFYEWYYDDFYDYEEAEDYYYSHGGK